MKKYKFSKTYIAAFFYRFAFLLLVPLIQGFLFAKSSAALLFTLYSTDLLVLVLLLSFAVIRCKKSRFLHSSSEATVKSGAIIRTEELIFKNKRCSFSFASSVFLRLFGGCRLKIFSSNVYSSAYLKRADKEEILKDILKESPVKTIPSGIFRNLLMSLSFSNALTGLLAAVPIIRRVSMIIGARQTSLILEGASLEGLLKFTGLPPLLSRISSILFFCFVIGFFTEFFNEYGLKFSKYPDYFFVSKGLITKTQAVISKNSVRALIFRQSLLMFLLGFYSGELSINIRPRQKIHVLSAARRSDCESLQEEIYGKFFEKSQVITPQKEALWGYTYLPILCFGASSLVLILFSQNIVIKAIFGVMCSIFAVWFLFRVFALFRSSLRFCEEFFEVKYFSGMNFTRVIFKAEDAVGFEVTQSLFQRKSGRCNLIFKIANFKALNVKIKHLNIKDAEKIKIPSLNL